MDDGLASRVGGAFWHLGVTVSDVEASLRFYRDLVGLELLELMDRTSRDFDRLSNNSGTAVRVAWLSDGPLVLQLIQYVRGGGDTLSLQHNRVGSPHLSFFVDDVDAAFAACTAAGATTLTPQPVPMGPYARSFYVLDPDGIPVEMWQWTDPAMVGRKVTP